MLAACNQQPPLEADLYKNWTDIETKEEWKLSADHLFKRVLNGQEYIGEWKRTDSLLTFKYKSSETTIEVDSALLTKDKSQTVLYQKGKPIGILKNGKTELFSISDFYEIVQLSDTQLQVIQNGKKQFFKSYAKQSNSLSFSLNHIVRGIVGLLVLLLICYLLSVNRKAIRSRIVVFGIVAQIVFAVLVFKVPFVKSAFEFLAGFFVAVLSFTKTGSDFLFAGLLNTESVGYLFAFQVLPTIIFFSALTSFLYYLGLLQRIVYVLAWLMSKTMRLSGAESLSTAANIFLGQTEAPMMIKPYIAGMTRSEILCVMIGGMASIAGGVLAAYVGFLGGTDPEQQKIFATHLLTASILSAPATIVVSKMLLPETESINETIDLPKEKIGANVLEAIANGTTDGVKLAVNVGAMLLVFTAFIAMFNFGLKNWVGEWTGLNAIIRDASLGKIDGLSFQLVLGYVFSPLAVVVGIPMDDMIIAGQLLGEKTVLNEFYAYSSLGKLKDAGTFIHAQSVIILTYALCGFSNFASIGIQIGGISIIAPNQKTTLSQLGFKALIGGTIACLMTACIAGMFF
jgi:CNT family concentrative nucleoside transporter